MAQRTQGTILRIATAAGSPKTITGITAANPPVVSSASHGLAAGTIILITGVVGMIELNNRAFVVANPATGTFELKGIDATGYTAYDSGGSATPQTMTEVGSVIGMDGFDGEAPDVDVSHLRSTATEKLTGLQDFGGLRLELFHNTSDAAHAKMRALKASGAVGVGAITQTDGAISAFAMVVKSFTWSAQANNAYRGNAGMLFATEPSWFA